MKNSTLANQHAVEVDLPMATVELDEDLDRASLAGDFHRIVLETVDEIFSSLGKEAKQSIYSQLEKTCKISKRDIPLQTEKFTTALERIIGPGARLLEIEMMKSLYEKVGSKFKYSPKKGNLTFTEHSTAIRVFLSVRTSEKPMPNEYYDYKFC